MKFSLKKAPLRTKFFLWTTAIIIGFCLASTSLYYTQMRRAVMRDALQQSEIILQEVEAIRDYVKTVIRPKAFELTGEDAFIVELMSTTYVSLRITETFQEKMENYTYRRVSTNPKNPRNRADAHEEEMAEWFEADRTRTFWQGMVEKQGSTFFVSMIPDFMSRDCLYCHGKVEDAPPELIERYGNYNGFRFKEGDLAGLNSVSIPISEPLSRLGRITAVIFLITLAASVCLLIVLNLLFDKLVLSRLVRVIEVIDEGSANGGELVTPGNDELDTLKDSFQHLSRYVRTAQKGSRQMPNFIGPYVIQRPLAAGTLSWIYGGYHAETGENVSLKIPFDNISQNPLYRACYRNEIKIMRNCNHPLFLSISDTIESVLICRDLTSFKHLSDPPDYTGVNFLTLFSRIFELVAYLHTHGIVHHDLRPGSFFMSEDSTPLLVDAGLAWWHKTPDELFSTGLGPQGNPLYLGPEQLEGKRGDSRSDIYSLGVWLTEFFTGETLFQRTSTKTAELIRAKHRLSLTTGQRLQLSPELAIILEKALQPHPEKRYQWIEDLRDDILPHIAKRQN